MFTRGRSEYREEFREHPLPARLNFKPEYHVVREDGRMEGVTTSKYITNLNILPTHVSNWRTKVIYLTTHWTHFYLQLCVVKHMAKKHSYNERGNPLPLRHGLFLPISSKVSVLKTIPQTGLYIPWTFLYHLWNTRMYVYTYIHKTVAKYLYAKLYFLRNSNFCLQYKLFNEHSNYNIYKLLYNNKRMHFCWLSLYLLLSLSFSERPLLFQDRLRNERRANPRTECGNRAENITWWPPTWPAIRVRT